jgi:hypothetical protein
MLRFPETGDEIGELAITVARVLSTRILPRFFHHEQKI